MTTTALDIITGAARLIGIVFKSEALDSDEAQDGLDALNEMLDTWSNDGLLTQALTLESFPLTGAASYTIGTGGAFNTTRPINIATAVVRLAGVDYPLTIITPEQYQIDFAVKSTASSIPEYLTYDNAYPLGTITMYAVPSAGATLRLLSNKPLTNLAALNTVVDLSPGWKRALKYNLALDMAPEYGAEVPQVVQRTATTSKGAIKRAASVNKAMPYMGEIPKFYSIYGGTE